MFSLDKIREYHCPRWNELPDIDLYMDQVMTVLEKNLSLFIGTDPQKAITPTMINNYVKQKMVRPPKNKKYDRGHLVSFFLITLLKQMMSITEVKQAIACVMTEFSPEKGYNTFCEVFEKALHTVFFDRKGSMLNIGDDTTETGNVITSVTLAYANMFYARYVLEKTAHDKRQGAAPIIENNL